jgi:hypothetical protein
VPGLQAEDGVLRVIEIPEGLPRDGKIVIASPILAVALAEVAPEHADRIFTLPGCGDDTVFVLDLDVIRDFV